MSHEKDPSTNEKNAVLLSEILTMFSDRRVCVVGPTCCGKSTLQKAIVGSRDMDKLLFGLLTADESQEVCMPWTPEVGKRMNELARQRLEIKPGEPVLGTVVLDCDVVIHLLIGNDLLRQRSEQRGVSFEHAKAMQEFIEAEVETSGLPIVHFSLG